MDGSAIEDLEIDPKPKKQGILNKIATKLKPANKKEENPKTDKIAEIDMEFDKDSDDWVFEGGAVTCEICNE